MYIEFMGQRTWLSGIATSVSRRHMVKPMPPRRPTMPRCVLFIPEKWLADGLGLTRRIDAYISMYLYICIVQAIYIYLPIYLHKYV